MHWCGAACSRVHLRISFNNRIWRNRKSYTNEVASEPQKPRALSKVESYLDACKLVAEYRSISIEQFFKEEPGRYKQYCRLVLEE